MIAEAGPQGEVRRHRRHISAVICVFTVIAGLLRFYQLSRPGYLLGVTEYDDGVNFGAALRLAGGVLPYRDFVFVQPPGSTELILPVALLAKVTGTAWGLGIARLLTAAADTACVALLGLLVRHRGIVAVAVASGVYCVFPDALIGAHTFLLEPWLNLFCLLGALAAVRGDSFADGARLAWAGAAFGFAATIKLWALVPLGVLGVLSVLAVGGRPWPAGIRWLPGIRKLTVLGGGAIAGLGAAVTPFLIVAPAATIRDVLTTQYARSNLHHAAPLPRLSDLAGFGLFGGTPAALRIAVLALLAAAIAAGHLAARRRLTPLDWYALAGLAAVTGMFLWPAFYHPHYGAFAGPFLALALATSAAAAPATGAAAAAARAAVTVAASRRRVIAVTAVAATALGTVGIRQVVKESQLRAPVNVAAEADRLIPPGACLFTDDVSFAISVNRFYSGVRGCPVIIDAFGMLLAATGGQDGAAPAQQVNVVRAELRYALASASYVWLAPGQIPWNASLAHYVSARFRLIGLVSSPAQADVPASGLYVRARKPRLAAHVTRQPAPVTRQPTVSPATRGIPLIWQRPAGEAGIARPDRPGLSHRRRGQLAAVLGRQRDEARPGLGWELVIDPQVIHAGPSARPVGNQVNGHWHHLVHNRRSGNRAVRTRPVTA